MVFTSNLSAIQPMYKLREPYRIISLIWKCQATKASFDAYSGVVSLLLGGLVSGVQAHVV